MNRILLWLVIALGAISTRIYFNLLSFFIGYGYSFRRTEAFIANAAYSFAKGSILYAKIGSTPYIVNVYNPLTYLPSAVASMIFDLSLPGILLTGRLISFASTVGLFAVVVSLVKRKTDEWLPALLAGFSLFLYSKVALANFYLMRPDLPGLFFTFAGVTYLLCHKSANSQADNNLPALLLFFVAFLFKQSFISAPIALCIYLTAERKYGDAFKFAASFAFLIAMLMLLLYRMTGTGYLDCVINAMMVNDISLKQHLFFVMDHAKLLALLICSMMALFFGLKKDATNRYLLIYLIVCFCWTMYSACKDGSDLNYYSELVVLMIIVTSISVGEKVSGVLHRRIALILLATAAIFVAIDEEIWKARLGNFPEDEVLDLSKYYDKYHNMHEPKLVFHERLAVQLGDPVGLDWYLINILVKKNLIKPDQLISDLRSGRYALVIFSNCSLSEIELDMFRVVRGGPYRLTYSDHYITEFTSTVPSSVDQ